MKYVPIYKKAILLFTAAVSFFYSANAQVGIDRSKKPPAGPPPVISLKDPAIYKLAHGTTLLVVEDHKLPKVTASLYINWDFIKEGEKAGAMDIMGQMLNEGTRDMTKAQFDEAVDKLGADLSISASGGSATALTRFFPQALELMGKAIKTPAFPQASFEKIKTLTLTGMKSDEKNVKAVSARVVNALAYGKSNPFGEFATENSVRALTLADVTALYHKYVVPSRAYLTIVGDIKPEEAKRLTDKFFSDWKGAPLVTPAFPLAVNPTNTEVDVVNMSNAVQSEITVTNLVELKLSNPDYFPLLMANQILGGGADSRLFMNLREKHGYTYGSYSSVGTSKFQSKFSASAAVRTAKTDSAVIEILREIDNLRNKPVSDDDLKNAKALYNGTFALGLEDTERMATFARNILINDLPKDFYRTYLQRINAVTKEDVMRVAKKYFNHTNTRVVVVGNTSQMLDGLKKLNYTVKEYDTYANPVIPAPAASVGAVKAADLFSNYLAAMGGAAELQKVKSINATMGMQMQGMAIDIAMKQMQPNMDVMTMSMGGNVMMKQTFNGASGYAMQMGAKKELTADEIKEKNLVTGLFEQMDYLRNPAFKTEVKGIEKVGGKDAYKVTITYPSGNVKTEYYDVASKLLVKSDETDPKTGAQSSREFSDYRKVGNILYPYTINLTISAGGQSQVLEMKVKDVKLNEGVTAADFN